MNLEELQMYAEQKDIEVVYWKIHNRKACVVKPDKYHILLNNHLIESARDEKQVLAHELGHCKSDQLYYLQDYCNPLYRQNISRAERIATDESCRLLVPLKELKKALKKFDNDYAVAESLDIDLKTLHTVIEYYKRKGLLWEEEV